MGGKGYVPPAYREDPPTRKGDHTGGPTVDVGMLYFWYLAWELLGVSLVGGACRYDFFPLYVGVATPLVNTKNCYFSNRLVIVVNNSKDIHPTPSFKTSGCVIFFQLKAHQWSNNWLTVFIIYFVPNEGYKRLPCSCVAAYEAMYLIDIFHAIMHCVMTAKLQILIHLIKIF